MNVIAQQHHWRTKLKQLIEKHHIAVNEMDFPEDWAERAIWREVEE